jgi:hypothetical protein
VIINGEFDLDIISIRDHLQPQRTTESEKIEMRSTPRTLSTSGTRRELTSSGRSSVKFRLLRQAELARRSPPPRQYYVIDEAVVRRHVGISRDPATMPNQLRHIADRAEREEQLTVRVIPFKTGAHVGLSGAFTLLEFGGAMPDLLYCDSGRDTNLITGTDPRIGQYADDFEVLLESALPATESIELMRQAAEDMS